jgi:hypothetical protein
MHCRARSKNVPSVSVVTAGGEVQLDVGVLGEAVCQRQCVNARAHWSRRHRGNVEQDAHEPSL